MIQTRLRRFTVLLLFSLSLLTGLVSAATTQQLRFPFYDPNSTSAACSATIVTGSLDKLLQAIAFHESHGNPTAYNARGPAYGKYQFITGGHLDIWKSSATAFYPLGLQYANAAQAPEAVQDAMEYLRFISVYNSVDGDLFAAAIYNYWPADLQIAHANHNDPRLNYAPSGNGGLTIKGFGDSIIAIINSGQSGKIPVLYSQAPDFAIWLAKAGGPPRGSSATATVGNTSSSCGSSSGAVAGNIVQTAINFSWPDRSPQSIAKIPKPEYAAALTQYNPNAPYGGADCGAFVATVMRASGADPNYPLSLTTTQANYVLSHPEKYDIQYEVTSTADLQPGDILIINAGSYLDNNGQYHIGNGAGASGHTMIYVGPQPPHNYNEASASGGERMANLGPVQLNDPLHRGIYMRARLK
ncbi:hypothetical protein HY218_01515 [Candidatus Saccharibacteria bacterium]|nr:hypothetical protein [Candidatus Saccharibacteria bacterium]